MELNMFTGLIESTGTIDRISNRGNYKVLTVKPNVSFENIELGESIAIDGVCLTVVSFEKAFLLLRHLKKLRREQS
jgi:riboflavin synthase